MRAASHRDKDRADLPGWAHALDKDATLRPRDDTVDVIPEDVIGPPAIATPSQQDNIDVVLDVVDPLRGFIHARRR